MNGVYYKMVIYRGVVEKELLHKHTDTHTQAIRMALKKAANNNNNDNGIRMKLCCCYSRYTAGNEI